MPYLLRIIASLILVFCNLSLISSPSTAAQNDLKLGPIISAGLYHNCAVTGSGAVRCWGGNSDGQTTVPNDLGAAIQVSVGLSHSCALTAAGSVRCWGSNKSNQTNIPSGLSSIVQISAGLYHTCALTSSGLVSCWGGNGFGQIDVPTDLGTVAQISAGSYGTCAVSISGTARCWGDNRSGQANVPTDLESVIQISAGLSHSCALTVVSVRCWGDNKDGQTSVPADLGTVIQISTGSYHTCVVTEEGLVRCWGGNNNGQTDVPLGLSGVIQISAGTYHNCLVTIAGAVRCWGYNGDGQGEIPGGLSGTVQISAGFIHTCALTTLIKCWGNNSDGQTDIPKDIGKVTQIATGLSHTCAVTESGAARCWGKNGDGQSNVPANLGLVEQISAGSYHTCAVTIAGTARCWGYNADGQSDVPKDLGSIKQISAGAYDTCAVTVAGLARCWGDNEGGRTTIPKDLGILTQIDTGTTHTCAVTVAGLARCWGGNKYGQTVIPNNLGAVSQISAGSNHTCAVTLSGATNCWGDNRSGQTSIPSDLGNVSQISAGSTNTCAITESGFARCWGGNIFGQSDVPGGGVTPIAKLLVPPATTTPTLNLVGSATVGSTLTAVPAGLDQGVQTSFQWTRDQVLIPNATEDTFKLSVADLQHDIGARVKVFKSGYWPAIQTSSFVRVSEGTLPALALPTVTGTLSVGSVLNVSQSDPDSNITFTYQWLRNGVAVSGADAETYALGMNDFAAKITVRATGSKFGYRPATVTSSGSIAAVTFANPTCSAPIDTGAWSTNGGEPAITGTPRFGQSLKATYGSWGTGTKFCSFWVSEGSIVGSANSITYKVQASDIGKTVRYLVVGKDKSGNSYLRYSKPVTILNATLPTPKNPTIKGEVKVGVKLTGNVTSWASGTTYQYQWLSNGSVIPEATSKTYVPTGDDAGSKLTVKVCGSKQFYDSLCLTSAEQTVASGVIAPAGLVSISGDSTKVGATLVGTVTKWMNGVTFRSQWFANGVPITGATSPTRIIQNIDRGKKLTYQVTASAKGYVSVIKASAPKQIP